MLPPIDGWLVERSGFRPGGVKRLGGILHRQPLRLAPAKKGAQTSGSSFVLSSIAFLVSLLVENEIG